ncbi:hypothetical protein C882_0643 [Caenispirillum salinarum AK4]|uniref:Uncharacterized protein n=1 Tax=Caenispirillum salinarum AK4 TaxID=1238182 RepID=K9GSA9_9PROT|nr:hypothetical protein [Caenispirillum salinarum]EKV28880.1 hypothetical protein C882_0643 [Caenispirillum salinarum AK4]
MSRKFMTTAAIFAAHNIHETQVEFCPARTLDLDYLIHATTRTVVTVRTPHLLTPDVRDLLADIEGLLALCRKDYRRFCSLPVNEPDPEEWDDEQTFPTSPLDIALLPWFGSLDAAGWALHAGRGRSRGRGTLLIITAAAARETVRII